MSQNESNTRAAAAASESADTVSPGTPSMSPTTQQVTAGLARRYAAEKRFRFYGMFAIAATLSFLAVLLISIVSKGLPAFTQTYMQLDVPLELSTLGIDQQTVDGVLDGSISAQTIRRANYNGAIREAMRERFPEVEGRSALRDLFKLVSKGAVTRLEDQSIAWGAELAAAGELDVRFNTTFFKNGDSREPELAGIRAALVGSAYTLLITFLLSFPVAVAAAIYLEEFAPKNRWTDLVEVNINNLAAVPSIVFGLLGLAVFINFFHLPRSAPLLGGIVLSLMTLPTIIISSRAALKSVPPSIREAARGLGASELQVVFHHVLPLAMPGILTGTIIGLAQALGETAPLLMIGMVAFIVDIPQGITDSATVLPVQVYLWADSPERAFTEKTSAAIMVLLAFLIAMNALAVMLRKRFERRW